MQYERVVISPHSIKLPKEWEQRKHGDDETHLRFVRSLAESIKKDGLLHDIAVFKDSEGTYRLNHGRNRLEAIKILGWKEVTVNLLKQPDRQAHLAENLWRKPLDRLEHYTFLEEWRKVYEAENPGTVRGFAGALGLKAKVEAAKAAEGLGEYAEKPVEPPPKPAKTFSKVVAERTGQSARNVQRALKRAREFKPDQLEAFDRRGVSLENQDALLKIEPRTRAQAIALIAAGKEPQAAIKEVTSKTIEPSDMELTDTQWFDKHCGDVSELLTNKHEYQEAALLYRRIRESRDKFKVSAKSALGKTKSLGFNPFVNVVRRIATVNHPSDWLVCSSCKGTGDEPDKSGRCNECKGAAFKMTLQEPKR